jgi:hypothetical protein
MTTYDRAADDQTINHGTHHADENFGWNETVHPGQLRWGDFHPGLVILPAGSAPASPGEINWEDTLGGKFALALRRLEGLLYAVYGSRPAAYSDGGGGWNKCQWYDRLHPRCFWAPEIWAPEFTFEGQIGCTNPEDAEELGCCSFTIGEYAALGDAPGLVTVPTPEVPIRSRSGDPEEQYADDSIAHDRTYFPVGSVSRVSIYEVAHDPVGKGWFGATLPGRQDSQSWLDESNGYIQYGSVAHPADFVIFRYQLPGGEQEPTHVKLHYKLDSGSWTTVTMATYGGGLYTYTLAAQNHGTECRWYVEYFYDPAEGDDVTRYDPGGQSIPEEEDAYYLQWWTHYNPYQYGLPELDPGTRHGTDWYMFDASENIQPHLITIARFILSWMGGRTCEIYDNDVSRNGCEETEARHGGIHHSPRLRGSGGECCSNWPIRWYWSGSSPWPHYRGGGKGSESSLTYPLYNRPGEPDDAAIDGRIGARKTWRGTWPMFRGLPLENPEYGDGFSWGVPPGQFQLWYEPSLDEKAKVHATFPGIGLRDEDVIDRVHVQEIIDAVEYLVTYGVWTPARICTRKRTPESFMGDECGHYQGNGNSLLGESTYEWITEEITVCQKCCSNNSSCSGGSHAMGWYLYNWNENDGVVDDAWYNPDIGCTPHATPSHADCMSECSTGSSGGACHMIARKHSICSYTYTFPYNTNLWGLQTCCDGECTSYPDESGWGCGFHYNNRSCTTIVGTGQCVVSAGDGLIDKAYCTRRVEGLSYFACAPGSNDYGWDDSHGSPLKKYRFDHGWHGGNWLENVPTGPLDGDRNGNPLGDMYHCGTVIPIVDPESNTGLWFDEVASVYWEGLVSDLWFEDCDEPLDCGEPCSYSLAWAMDYPPPVPGYGYFSLNGDGIPDLESPLCYKWQCIPSPPTLSGTPGVDGHQCQCEVADFAVCRGEATWVAIDLRLDGSEYAYASFLGRNGDLDPYSGLCVPTLSDYSLSEDPDTWTHDCPCETWTSEDSECPTVPD